MDCCPCTFFSFDNMSYHSGGLPCRIAFKKKSISLKSEPRRTNMIASIPWLQSQRNRHHSISLHLLIYFVCVMVCQFQRLPFPTRCPA